MFKKISLFLSLLTLGLFISTQTVRAVEKIANFDVVITINSDATLNVVETIAYDFGTAQKHGIYRDIPVRYKLDQGTREISLSDISVLDENGVEYNFELQDQSAYERIKIGDADVLVSGRKYYKIYYTVAGAINSFSDHEELYWNATGNEWPVVIDSATAQVNLPQVIPSTQVTHTCFSGASGAKTSCQNAQLIGDLNNNIESVEFDQTNLDAKEGLTVVVGIPKGILPEQLMPTAPQGIIEKFQDFVDTSPIWAILVGAVILWPVYLFIFLFYRWWRYGRDPKGRRVIITQFDAPDNLTPLEVGTLYDENAEHKDLSAEIISLAIRGYLKINRIEEKQILGKHIDYELLKLKSVDETLSPVDKKILNGIFTGDKNKIILADLKAKFFSTAKEVFVDVGDTLTTKGYFQKSPSKVRGKYIGVGAVFAMVGYFIGGFIGWIGTLECIAAAIMLVVFGYIMPARTKKGVLAKEYILGLKSYLQVAEKDRINFHNAPEKNPQLFEKLLPYAMVLGVESQWAKQFTDIYLEPPTWYGGNGTGTFNSLILLNSLNSFKSSANNTLYASPQSAGGGGSGFSGGFSGGGFGGGGGGSW